MTDHHIRAAERRYEAEMAEGDRLEAKIKEILPDVLANPADHDIDVDLGTNGDISEFLSAVFAKPDWNLRGVEVWKALYMLKAEYDKLAEKAAESLAQDEIYNEDAYGDIEE